MPKFIFTVTRSITESATVKIIADSIEEAQARAVTSDIVDTLTFSPDDGTDSDVYIPDPDDYEEIAEQND